MHAVNTVDYPKTGVGTVASEERSALIGAPMRLLEPAMPEPVDFSDATQQLLTSLGRFQRELTNALDESQRGFWAEECMNQLIDCVEVALPHGWSDMVEALTDTGRILQSYEIAGQPDGCVDFLNDAYELLCLMVGDLIVDEIRPAVMKQWRERYQRATARLERDGLALAADDGNSSSSSRVVTLETAPLRDAAEDLPFGPLDESPVSATDGDSLPTLDELPPLDAVLATNAVGIDLRSFPAVPAKVSSENELAGKRTGPSRLVVEILDQLCEQLAIIGTETADRASYAMDRFTGGVRALEREAREDEHPLAAELCEMMLRAARLAKTPAHAFHEGLSELGYAFCGVYMDAFREDDADLESVSLWRAECTGLIGTWQGIEDQAAAPPAEIAIEAPAFERIEPPAVESPLEAAAPLDEKVNEGAVPPETELAIAIDAAPDETTSAGLLEAAQRAAKRGDAAEAKRFALQAAGAIARDEVGAASTALTRAQERLKAGLEATREARDYVRETETAVQELAAGVCATESALGKVREDSAKIAQRLEELRSGVADIERQIAELQERREQELENVARSASELDASNRNVAETEEELAERRAAEAAARTDLETRRQSVHDLQRAANEIEAGVDKSSLTLDEKQKSFDDITEAIRHICGGAHAVPRDEGLLF